LQPASRKIDDAAHGKTNVGRITATIRLRQFEKWRESKSSLTDKETVLVSARYYIHAYSIYMNSNTVGKNRLKFCKRPRHADVARCWDLHL